MDPELLGLPPGFIFHACDDCAMAAQSRSSDPQPCPCCGGGTVARTAEEQAAVILDELQTSRKNNA